MYNKLFYRDLMKLMNYNKNNYFKRKKQKIKKKLQKRILSSIKMFLFMKNVFKIFFI